MSDTINPDSKPEASAAKRAYEPAQLRVWGSVTAVTHAGGSGGAGDVAFNPADQPVGREDGSITLPFG